MEKGDADESQGARGFGDVWLAGLFVQLTGSVFAEKIQIGLHHENFDMTLQRLM